MSFVQKLVARLSLARPRRPDVLFADISEIPPDEALPALDRESLDNAGLTPDQREWRENGALVLRGFLADDITEPYIRRREAFGEPAGWMECAPYMHVDEMRQLALHPPLMAKLKELIGEDMMLHLCLTNWITSQREWHQDDYLNPSFVNCWYAAVWIALGDIHPDSGPFEYIPGSHRWPLMRGDRLRALLGPQGEELHWAKFSERISSPAVNYEIARRRAPVRAFTAKRGDVLIWHARLMHQGAKPKVPGMERRSLIAHYSGVNHRPDMGEDYRVKDENGETYVAFGVSTAV
ncbi:phytanoyl-CoA dioxygenase family protein [Acidocella sp.]|uniref:phytanoyl-CoA dioxygenase family protein n=1 Tax=Acidocella sp. TaxID=50710 RepID=UPI00260DEDB8|nr:phytanoyl-CoA dioxygenase family protein [Acidocella sp.]